MEYTSAQANKLLKKLQEEREDVLSAQQRRMTFIAATSEDLEAARPDYDYAGTQARLGELEEKIRRVKHAINTFNLTHEVEGFGMTVDQMLIYLPQLTERKQRLGTMANALEKNRLMDTGRSGIIEYEYANYDVAQAQADYEAAGEELSRAQLALDKLNTTQVMEIDV